MTRVLVIDDEPQILRALRINLSVRGYDVSVAATGAEALKSAAEHKPDVVILDLGTKLVVFVQNVNGTGEDPASFQLISKAGITGYARPPIES